jgi:hypothetical protein
MRQDAAAGLGVGVAVGPGEGRQLPLQPVEACTQERISLRRASRQWPTQAWKSAASMQSSTSTPAGQDVPEETRHSRRQVRSAGRPCWIQERSSGPQVSHLGVSAADTETGASRQRRSTNFRSRCWFTMGSRPSAKVSGRSVNSQGSRQASRSCGRPVPLHHGSCHVATLRPFVRVQPQVLRGGPGTARPTGRPHATLLWSSRPRGGGLIALPA